MARVSNKYATILRGSLDSRKMAAVSMEAEWLFQRILVAVDCAGRYYGDGFDVACKICTTRMKAGQVQVPEVQAWLDELEAVGLIVRYEAGGDKLLRVVDYFRPANSKIKPEFKADPAEGSAFPQQAEAVPPTSGTHSPLERSNTTQHNTTEHNSAAAVRASARAADIPEAEPPQPQPKPPAPVSRSGFDPPAWIPDAWLNEQAQKAESLCSMEARLSKVTHATKMRALRLACIQFAGDPPKGWDAPGSTLWVAQLGYKRVAAQAAEWLCGLAQRKKPGAASIETYVRACAEHGPDVDGWLPAGTAQKEAS